MNNETTVSGSIKYSDGGGYLIRSKNGQGWQIPTRDITADDLRKMADHIDNRNKA